MKAFCNASHRGQLPHYLKLSTRARDVHITPEAHLRTHTYSIAIINCNWR